MPAGPKKKGTPPKETPAQAFNRGMRNKYDTLHTQYSGFHSKEIEKVLAKAFTDDERKSQFLTHLATVLKKWYQETHEKPEIELQIAICNSKCFIISSNANETANNMYNLWVAKAATTFHANLEKAAVTAVGQATKSKAVESQRIRRHSMKLAKELAGERGMGGPLIEELKAEGKTICVRFDANDPSVGDSFTKFLKQTEDMAGKFVAVVIDSGGIAHAEQKILAALMRAAGHDHSVRTLPVVVAGTFRPCRGCFESLSIVQKYCFENLRFGSRPGHFWMTTATEHMKIFELLKTGGFLTPEQIKSDFDEDGLLIGLTDTSHRPELRLKDKKEVSIHYTTESDTDEG